MKARCLRSAVREVSFFAIGLFLPWSALAEENEVTIVGPAPTMRATSPGAAAAPRDVPPGITLVWDCGDPTPQEQMVLEIINRARANPDAEGVRLGIDIHEGLPQPSLVGPRPALA